MGEQPIGGEPVRDATGLVVGSPAWLEMQRQIERGQTPEKLKKQASWQIVLGVVIIAIGLFIGIKVITGRNDLGFELTPYGYVVVFVLPYLIGGAAILHGIRQRDGRAPRSGATPATWATPPSPTGTPPPSTVPTTGADGPAAAPYAPPVAPPYVPPTAPPLSGSDAPGPAS